ncbi:hypothetical protein ES703_57320 [subsurface metagenome]
MDSVFKTKNLLRGEEVTTMPPPSKDQLNKIVKFSNPDNKVTKVYVCVENSERGYQWTQIAVST